MWMSWIEFLLQITDNSMIACNGLLILGFGGHARSVADVALAIGYKSIIFLDENARDNENFLGYPVQREFQKPLPADWQCIPAAGDNKLRQLQVEHANTMNWNLATLIAPTATIGAGALISVGSFVAHHSHVGPMAKVGVGCIVNSGAIVEHECYVGDFSHVSVNATIAGRTRIGRFVFIGAGAVVIDSLSVADNVIVGAGGIVVTSLEYSGTYVGMPVRQLD